MIMHRKSDGSYEEIAAVKTRDGSNIGKIVSKDGSVYFTSTVNVVAEGYPCVLQNSVGKSAVNYSIYGNSVQTGTPSPENPVEVVSVGDKTKNLCPELNDLWTLSNHNTVCKIEDGVLEVQHDSSDISDTAFQATSIGIWLEAGDYILSFDTYVEQSNFYIQSNSSGNRIKYVTDLLGGKTLYGGADKNIPQKTWTRVSFSVSLPNDDYYSVSLGGDQPNITKLGTVKIKDVQLELSSTPTEYEPDGYKIPVVTSGENSEPVTTNIYLDKPLETGEILKFPENVLVHTDGTEETVILPKIPTFKGTTVITTDTEIQPSNMEITYKSRR